MNEKKSSTTAEILVMPSISTTWRTRIQTRDVNYFVPPCSKETDLPFPVHRQRRAEVKYVLRSALLLKRRARTMREAAQYISATVAIVNRLVLVKANRGGNGRLNAVLTVRLLLNRHQSIRKKVTFMLRDDSSPSFQIAQDLMVLRFPATAVTE